MADQRSGVENRMRHSQSRRKTYLRSGAEPIVDRGRIQSAIPAIALSKHDRLMRYSLGSAYLDLAQHPDTPAAERASAIRKAQKHLGILSVAKMTGVPTDTEAYGIGLKADMQSAYLPKITSLAGSESLGAEDELKLYGDLLSLSQSALQQTNIIKAQQLPDTKQLTDLAGTKAELSLHVLNARGNLREGFTRQAWPGLERQDLGRTTEKYEERKWRTGWDLAISNGEFWDPTADSLKRIQVKSSAQQIDAVTPPYHPDITVIKVRQDIGAPAHNILEDALTEAFQDGEPFEAAQSRLDNYQRNFTGIIT